MNKIFNIAGRIVLGVCIYGAYRKTYDWGKEYMNKDITAIRDAIDSIFDSKKSNKEA